MRLKDKVAIITGGGSGFGEVTARLFASEGAEVMLADINGEAAAAVAESINKEGGRAVWVKTDVSSATSVEAMVQSTLSAFEHIDILFNNAGIESFGTVIESDEATWDRTFAVHVRGAYLCSKYAVPAMISSGQGGVVINVSSVAGLVGLQHMSAYSAAKGAIISLTRSMAADFAQHGIRVNCIAPGTSMTPLGQRLIENDTPERLAQRLSRYPLGRFGQPAEIARSVLFLASEDSSYATGMCLVIDGGLTAI
ncbi:MAG TPA: SDR family oxidoreductase [Ktedonobacteraceae bacterium]|jgi:NAD(P)-dependent dehydrogenase (short-subunit alcohol dehydrogenase family)|nr:SDR family oxidoreductase [Ktedonobacteraceae bacterium]